MASASRTQASRRSRATPRPSRGERSPVARVAPGSLLGREGELSELSEVLGRERLVTLTGAPGIGKSRLALAVTDGLRGGGSRRGAVVELASVAGGRSVAGAVAAALSIDEVAGEQLVDTLVSRLSRRRLALVLDNCEHLLSACAKLVDRLLGGCPGVRVLTTSREPLGLGGEVVWEVPPLALPGEGQPLGEVAASPAVRLFVQRAAWSQPGFVLSAYVAPAVVEIVRRLDGIPLAIELAAARVDSLTAQEISERLNERFALLSRGGADGLPHHQTLEAALDWSHALLSEAERALLRRLAVFSGSFEVGAAAAVCADEHLGGAEIGGLLSGLVSKSLVQAGGAQGRYRLLETIRDYAAGKLGDAGETAAIRAAHAHSYLALAEQAEPELTGPDQQGWLERLEAERPNLRSAVEWSLSHGDTEQALCLAGALVLFWRVRCHFSEGRELLDAAVAVSDKAPVGLRAKALWGAGFMALMVGDNAHAIAPLEQSLALFRQLEDRQGCARALMVLGNAIQVPDPTRALALLAESATLARQAGDAWCLAHALGVAGHEHAWREELPIARELFEQCLAVAREAEDQQGLRYGLIGLGSVALGQGDLALAESLLEEAVAVTERLGEDYSRAVALEYLGQLEITRGDYGRARELLDDALVLHRELGLTGLNALESRATLALAAGDRRHARVLLEKVLDSARARQDSPSRALRGLGELAAAQGDAASARRLLKDALTAAREHGEKGATAKILFSLGQLARAEGNHTRAAALHDEALSLQHEITSGPGIVASLEALAGLATTAGRYEHAARLFAATQALRNANGWARSPWDSSSNHEADVALVRQALPGPDFEASFAQGAELSLEQAVAQARKGRGPRGRPTSGFSSLTDAERRVAELAAERLTTPEIAARLFVSAGTVKTHLSHIFAKLGIRSRRELRRSLGVEDTDA